MRFLIPLSSNAFPRCSSCLSTLVSFIPLPHPFLPLLIFCFLILPPFSIRFLIRFPFSHSLPLSLSTSFPSTFILSLLLASNPLLLILPHSTSLPRSKPSLPHPRPRFPFLHPRPTISSTIVPLKLPPSHNALCNLSIVKWRTPF